MKSKEIVGAQLTAGVLRVLLSKLQAPFSETEMPSFLFAALKCYSATLTLLKEP